MRYICSNCGYIYDEEKGDIGHGIASDTKFDDLDNNWICPVCYAGKDKFDLYD